MQVQNVECHLAQAQLKRFLAGDDLPEDLLVDLEHHVRNCPDCRKAAEKSGGGPISAKTPEGPASRPPWAVVMDVLKRKPSGAQAPVRDPADILAAPGSELAAGGAPKNRLKVALLTTALAVVLVAMTLISQDPTALFGRKASESPLLAGEQKAEEPAVQEVSVLDAMREGAEDDPLGGVQPAPMGNGGGPVADVALMAAQRAIKENTDPLLADSAEPAPKAQAPAPRVVAAREQPPAPRVEQPRAPAQPQATPRAGVRRIEVPEGVVIPEEPTLGDRVVVAEPRPRPAQPRASTRREVPRNQRSGVGTTRVFDETGRPIRP